MYVFNIIHDQWMQLLIFSIRGIFALLLVTNVLIIIAVITLYVITCIRYAEEGARDDCLEDCMRGMITNLLEFVFIFIIIYDYIIIMLFRSFILFILFTLWPQLCWLFCPTDMFN